MTKHIAIAIITTPKILLLKRRDVRLWAFPGGKVEVGERTFQEAC